MIPAPLLTAQAGSLRQAAFPESEPSPAGGSWQALWRDAVRDPRELLYMLGLHTLADQVSDTAAAKFALRVPRGFVARMRHGDRHDPLLRQVLPVLEEDQVAPGFSFDAVGDGAARGATGVIHKYLGRALLIATGSCAIHCRYCFRRHFPYGEETAAANHWREPLDYLKADPTITEVLLSGGDPLSLATSKLAELTEQLRPLPQIRRLRLHTRLPSVLPERIDQELLDWIGGLPWPLVMVVHVNHANELDRDVALALGRLKQAGVTLLNQSVLLRGVNDEIGALADLSERLFEAGVLPYYLHQLDRVAGAGHFEVGDVQARELYSELRGRLPGYLVPLLVREIAGSDSKTPL